MNDIDGYIVNFWRSLQHAPDEVANYANNPVNEIDLTARHIWLVNEGAERLLRLQGDPEYYDAKVAGWWVWGINCWIGSGWCSSRGPWSSKDGRLINLRETDAPTQGVKRNLMHLSTPGQGVNRKRIHLSNPGQGVKRTRIHLGTPGRGVNRKRIHLSNPGRGINRTTIHSNAESLGVQTGEREIAVELNRLAERLRYVRVACGDWKRVVTDGALSHGATVGIFLDPPYSEDIRGKGLYTSDREHGNINSEVYEWCMANQDNPRYRIVLAGYEGEHDMPDTWRKYSWKAKRSYGNAKGETANSENRKKERLWFSPNCLQPLELF